MVEENVSDQARTQGGQDFGWLTQPLYQQSVTILAGTEF